MEVININELGNFQEAKTVKKIPIISNQLMSSVFFIDTNTKSPSHEHSCFDELHYIIKGSGKINVDSESQLINEGMLVLVPFNKTHYFETDNEQLTVLSINLVPNEREKVQ